MLRLPGGGCFLDSGTQGHQGSLLLDIINLQVF